MSDELTISDSYTGRRLKIERQADGRLRTERLGIPDDAVLIVCEPVRRENILDALFVMIDAFAAAAGVPPERIYLCKWRDEQHRENVLYLETADPIPAKIVKFKDQEAIDV
jgi:hypothetical protein